MDKLFPTTIEEMEVLMPRPNVGKSIEQELSYAVEDGRLDVDEAKKLLKDRTQANKWLDKQEDYDPY